MSTSDQKTGPDDVSLVAGSGNRSGHEGSVGTARPPRRGRVGQVAVWWWALPAIVLTFGIQYLGVGAGSVYAFTDWSGIGGFDFIGFDNFVEIFSSPEAVRALGNTLLIAACFVIFTNIAGLALAVRLNRLLKSRYVLRVLVFMPVVLSPLAVAYVWKFIFQPNGPLNAFLRGVGLDEWATAWLGDPDTAIWTIVVVVVWQNIGLAMVIFLAGLANVPPELEEAAAVDGASGASRFFRIVLPLLRPTIVISSALALIQGLRVFDQVQALTGGGPYRATETLATLVYRETFVNGRFGYGAALSVILTILITVAAIVQVTLLRQRED